MAEVGYQGTYVRFESNDKDTALGFLSADNAVGDRYTIKSSYEGGERTDWIVNQFGQTMGKLDGRFADQFDLIQAKGWEYTALLSFVAFTEGKKDEAGFYWGEIGVIAYEPQYKEAFEGFIEKVSKAMGDGIHPDLNIGKQGIREIISKNGDYLPTGRRKLPKEGNGMAFVKTERTNNEKLIAEARKGNKGCHAITWVIYAALAALVVYGLHMFGLF